MMFGDTPVDDVYSSFMPEKRKRRRDASAAAAAASTANAKESKKKKRGRSLKRSDSNHSIDSIPNYFPPIADVRTLPDTTSKPPTHVIANDTDPHRISNPLLVLPSFPNGVDVPLEEIPSGGELWNIAELVFGEADTWPVWYLGRLLGFDLPLEDVSDPDWNVESVAVKKDDGCKEIPSLGRFVSIYKNENDDDKLSYMDPLWKNLCRTFGGYNGDFRDAGKGYAAELSPVVGYFAKERGILCYGVVFRMATVEDLGVLLALEEKVCGFINVLYSHCNYCAF
jgi:hypothetical protein